MAVATSIYGICHLLASPKKTLKEKRMAKLMYLKAWDDICKLQKAHFNLAKNKNPCLNIKKKEEGNSYISTVFCPHPYLGLVVFTKSHQYFQQNDIIKPHRTK